MEELNNQIMFGCVIIGIALSIIDIYVAENILIHEGAGRGIMAITTGGFCGIFCMARITKFKESSDKESE